MALPQRKSVGVPGGEIADVQTDLREAGQLGHFTLLDEPVSDPALVEDLDGAGMQTARTCTDQGLVSATFDDGDIDSGQSQFG
ncbi:hypothetical protein MPRG_57320 [Mycobacterium paragordonae]|uniref:Uncharacterized protein n=1 Tax=Mycobacterium paragordonae TaxID=1389713 RepID=A0ABQ1CDZ6_9MYCO|nr:hypothetical protein MPRG_57320 [Mycobacterium paragordonae]